MEGKKTALYDEHVRLGGKIVNYAGWLLPVQYAGLIEEHNAVRQKLGVFDVSHMGEVWVTGKDAFDFVNHLITNDLHVIEDGQVQYNIMCYDNGGAVDDLLVYRYNQEKFFLVINAANVEKDFEWITKQAKNFDVKVENVSDQTSQIAVQGPLAQKAVQKLTDVDLDTIKFFHFVDGFELAGKKVLISRTGYTGEDGFEIYTDNDSIVHLYKEVLKAGEEFGIEPCGLGCRDTLRFEAMLPLYGHEISQDISPVEGGLNFFVKLDQEADFIGKEALKKIKADNKRILVGFEMIDKAIPREGYEIEKDGKKIGYVTTGYLSPTLGKKIGNALIDASYKEMGAEFDVIIRGKAQKAKQISRKFLKEVKK